MKLIKKALVVLLSLVMLLGIIPMNMQALSITGATGDGTSEKPFEVDTFAELKAALQMVTSETVYVKLSQKIATSEIATSSIVSVGDKVLTIETDTAFSADASSTAKSLIEVDGKLTIKGTGSITYFHRNKDSIGAVISMKDNEDARLTIQSDVTLIGTTDLDRNVWVASIYANKGALLITDGEYIGATTWTDDDSKVGALTLAGDVHAYIEGGYFHAKHIGRGSYAGYEYDFPYANGLLVENGTITDNIYIYGGIFRGLSFKCSVDDIVPNGYGFYDDYNKCMVDRYEIKNALFRDDTKWQEPLHSPVYVLNLVPPKLTSWEPFYFADNKSSTSLHLLRNKAYDIKVDPQTNIGSDLTNLGFWLRRSYTLYDANSNVILSDSTDDINDDISTKYSFSSNGQYKLQIKFETIFEYQVVYSRYFTFNITVSNQESLSSAKFSMTPPVVGATPSTVNVVGGEVDYNFQGAWYEFNGVYDNGAPKVGKLLSATDTFESGKQYMAAVRITLSENLVFSSDFAGYINGNKAAFMGDASPSSNGVVIWAAYTPYEKDYYIDLTTVTPIEGEEIPGNPLVALNEYIPTRGSALARWYDEHGELIEGGKFVGGKVYYVTYLLRSKPNSKLPSIAQTEFRVNGETPDNVELYQASSGDSYIYKITHAVHCVDKIEFYFTEGSYPEANASMTVDIERIVEQSDELLTAYFDDDYSVQWYRDGYELDGANDLSLSFEIKDTLYTYYCVLTVGDTVLKSYEFMVTKHVHKYTGEYAYDSENHEIACNDPNCDDYSGSVITEPHSLNADGNCLICGYVTAMLGDVNDDKKVDSVDYLLVKRACFKTYELDASQFVRADLNGDKNLDSTDYLLVKRIAFGTYKVS